MLSGRRSGIAGEPCVIMRNARFDIGESCDGIFWRAISPLALMRHPDWK
jgi:hypothetical protein